MGQQMIYVEGLGFIPIQSGQTPQQAIATASAGKSKDAGVGNLGLDAGNQRMGVSLPPMDQGSATNALRAIPQAAGMVAQFTPLGKAGYAANAAVPSIIEVIRQVLSGEPIDPVSVGAQGAMGAGSRLAGRAVEGVGNMGIDKILKALGLGSDATDASITMLPKLAVQEGARLTKASEGAIRNKAVNTASGGLEELADQMGTARRAAEVAPSRITFWPQEAAANYLRDPRRQMAMGQNMVSPFGLADTKTQIAPTVEAMLRAALAERSTKQGPRRRGQ